MEKVIREGDKDAQIVELETQAAALQAPVTAFDNLRVCGTAALLWPVPNN